MFPPLNASLLPPFIKQMFINSYTSSAAKPFDKPKIWVSKGENPAASGKEHSHPKF